MNNLRIGRPIVFIDLETTGLSTSQDRIVELTVLKVHSDSEEEERSVRLNPGIQHIAWSDQGSWNLR